MLGICNPRDIFIYLKSLRKNRLEQPIFPSRELIIRSSGRFSVDSAARNTRFEVFRPGGFLISAGWSHFWPTCHSCRRHYRIEQVAQADQVVGDHVQAKHRTHLACAAQLELAQAAPLFDPAKHFLDAAAGIDRLGVALVAGCAAIDGGATRAAGVLSDMRRHADSPELSDHSLGVVVLIGTKGFLVGTRDVSCHRFGGIPLSGARGLRHLAIDDQGMAIVHEHIAPVAGQCWMGIGLAGQQRVGIAAGAVGGVAELMPRKSPLARFLPGFGSPKHSPGPDGGGGGSS